MPTVRTWLFVLSVALPACSGTIGGSPSGEPGGGSGAGGEGGAGSSADNGGTPGKPVARNPSFDLKCPSTKSPSIGSSPLVRLTNAEYANTLQDLFGAGAPKPSLPPEVLADGFNNDAVSQSASTVLIENLEATPLEISDAMIDKVVPCQPTASADESGCLDKLFSSFGKRAFRRPLTAAETARFKAVVATLRKTDDFATSARTLVRGMLQAPQFLYRVETGKDAGSGGSIKLTSYEVASRLSYLLWDSMPDDDLLAAAETGALDTPDGIAKQASRLLSDPRARVAVSDFVRQWLEYDRIDKNIEKKDLATFPKYTAATKTAISDGLRKFVDEAIWNGDTSLKTILLDKTAYVTDASAFIYNLKSPGSATVLKATAADGAQRAGLLTQAGFLSGFGHETLQAPILRGIFVLDRLLCQPPLPAPPNVNTALADPPKGSGPTTLRQRIEMSHEKGGCISCHRSIDNVGFGMENFDAIGQFRTTENGLPVDPRGSISDTFDANGDFMGAVELSERLAKSEQVSECVTAKMFQYALSRAVEPADGCTISSLTDGMVASEGNIKAMLLALVNSDSFRYRATLDR